MSQVSSKVKVINEVLNDISLRGDGFGGLEWLGVLRKISTMKSFRVDDKWNSILSPMVQGNVNFIGVVHYVLLELTRVRCSFVARSLIPQVVRELPAMTPKALALSAWSLSKMKILDFSFWEPFCDQILISDFVNTFSPKDLSMCLFAILLSQSTINKTNEIVFPSNISNAISRLLGLILSKLATFSIHDLCMTLKGLTFSVASDTSDYILIFRQVIHACETSAAFLPAEDIVDSFTYLSLRMKDSSPPECLEFLLEQSRRLRLDPSFSDTLCTDLAKAVFLLKIKDPRMYYQLINFVQQRGNEIVGKNLIVIIKTFAQLGINDANVWGKLCNRFEKEGLKLTLQELRAVGNVLRGLSGVSESRIQRFSGINSLFISLKEDQELYGPC